MTSTEIKQRALSLGFTLAGVAALKPTPESQFYGEWPDRGYAREMHYLTKQKPQRMDPQSVLEGAQSVIVCAANYNTQHPTTSFDPLRAWISRYAWGTDYHETLKGRLTQLAQWVQAQGGRATKTYVDTGPLTERVFARYAGIGWF